VLIGDELGFYRALAKDNLTPAELARRTGTNERHVREWLGNQTAGGYVDYDARSGRYALNEEQALCLADPGGPVDLPGAYMLVQDLFHILPRALDNFRTGQGMEWGEHHPCLFHGTERFFRAGYNVNLLHSWLPALEGVVEKLTRGGRGSDVGCGHGASMILMAKAFPNAEFIGYDDHAPSIDIARQRARGRGPQCAEARRHVHDRRAGRGQCARRQSKPGRARLLWCVLARLRTGLAGAKWSGAGGPSRRNKEARAGGIGRIRALPPRDRDAL
jgi:Rv2258c-like winged HTH domain/Methyltransferase domain